MAQPVYRFGDCRLDPSARELHHAGALLSLSPKVFDCLAYLIGHRDRAVGRDELIAAVWGRVDVTDTLLGQTVLKARRAVGDTGNEQNTIRTVPRFGYRWVADVSIEESTSPDADATAPAQDIGAAETSVSTDVIPASSVSTPASPVPIRQRTAPSRTLPVIVALLLIVAAFAAWQWSRQHDVPTASDSPVATKPAAPSDSPDATAVLPVEVTGQGDWSWLRLGLMDLVATRMRRAGVAVVPSDNVVALARTAGADVAKKVSEGTGAHAVVFPSATRFNDGWRVKLTLRAVDGSEREVEARHADVIEAGRAAADRLLALLGKRPADLRDEARDLPASELLSRAEAALLTDDLAGARQLLESAPASAQNSPELRLRLAQIDFRAGEWDSARKRLDSLLVEVTAETNPVLRGRVLNGSGVVYLRLQNHAQAEREFTEAIGLLESRAQPAALGQAYTGRAVTYASDARYDLAFADFSRARVALELAGDALALARVEANEGFVSARRGHYAEALSSDLSSAQRFERFGALNELVLTLLNAAEAQGTLLQPKDALATIERAWPLLTRLENRSTRRQLQVERASALAANGRLDEARVLLAELTADVAKNPEPLVLARVQAEQAALDFTTGRFDSAAALATAAVAGFDDADFQRERVSAWLLLTRALRAQGKPGEADRETDRLLAWAKDRSSVPIPVYAALADAERNWAARKHDTASSAYAAALAEASRVEVPADSIQVIASYGTRLIVEGELDRASAIVGQASRWADRDFASAVLQARYYRALGEQDAWQSALKRVHALAGERAIPPSLERLPGSGTDDPAARVL